MGIVDFNTSIWKDGWFRKLKVKEKILFVFLWTNDHKNLPCMYEMDIETMAFHTGLTAKEIKDTLSILYPKVKYDFEKGVVWVVNFARHQFMRTKNTSYKIKVGILNNLVQMNGHFFIGEFLEEYQALELSYTYPIDTVPEGYQYPPGAGGGEGKGGGKGGGARVKKPFIPPTLDEAILFFKDNGYTESIASKAWNGYNDADWHDTKGNKIKNWKQKFRFVWFKDENKPGSSPATDQSYASIMANQPPLEDMI